MPRRPCSAALLAFASLTVLAEPVVGESGRWERQDSLVDFRLGAARDVSREVTAGAAFVELPRPLRVDGRLAALLEVGPGWIAFHARRPAGVVEVAPEATRLVAAPLRLDVLSGTGVEMAPGSPVLVEASERGAVVRWTGLTTGLDGGSIAEASVDALGAVRVQYLRLTRSARRGLDEGRLHAGLGGGTATAGGLAPAPAAAFVLPPRSLRPATPRPALPEAEGDPPVGCEPAPGTWCDVTGGAVGQASVFLTENFNDGASASRGWTSTGPWHEVPFLTCGGGATSDPGMAWYVGQDASCSYASNVTASLFSPPVGPVTVNTFIEVWNRVAKEDGAIGPIVVPVDFVEIYVNGGLLGSYLDPGDPNVWFPIRESLAPWAGQVVTIEFRFTSDGTVEDLGWFVDDVEIWDAGVQPANCISSASLGENAPCDQVVSDQWNFDENLFCNGCTYTFYALVECGREMHLPLWDMEGTDLRITDVLTGQPTSLRCINGTAAAQAAGEQPPPVIQGDCCGTPGVEMWWGPPFDVTDDPEPGRVRWGLDEGCPNISQQYDLNGNGLECSELPGCGGLLDRISPGEQQVMDCYIQREEGLCGIYRLDITSGGFIWSLFANCDGTDTPQFQIFNDCTQAWAAFNPLPELAVENLAAVSGCPDIELSFDIRNIGCADFEGQVPVRLVSNCPTPDILDVTVDGPVRAGDAVTRDVTFTASCGPVEIEIFVDPDDLIEECTESISVAACRAEEGIDSAIAETCECSPVITTPVEDQTICEGGTATLNAAGLGLDSCVGDVTYLWTDPAGTEWLGEQIMVSPAETTTYSVTVQCTGDPLCAARQDAVVTVHRAPLFSEPSVRDVADCNLGIELAWEPATFLDTPSGHYNVYRSETSCVGAVDQASVELMEVVATGVQGARWVDTGTVAGTAYWYVVEAEDDTAGTSCPDRGRVNQGSVRRYCVGPVTDAFVGAIPDGVYTTLFGSHAGGQVSFRWTTARPLLPDEHFHLLKATGDPRALFTRANPEADVQREHSEPRDPASEREFFDLRVANECEQESLDEYPEGFDR